MENEKDFCGFATVEQLKSAYLALVEKSAKDEETIAALKANGECEGVPCYEKEDWGQRVKAFVAAYPIAKDFGKEIAVMLAGDRDLALMPTCLESALISLLLTERQNNATDTEGLKQLAMNDPEVKEAIIKEYVASLERKLPRQISGGGATVVTPPKSPRSVKEATALVKQLFK